MDVICIDANFTKKQQELFNVWGIITPEQNKVYSIRDTIRTWQGMGIFLNEIKNREILMKKGFSFEPNWAIRRFTDLQGNPLTISGVLAALKAEKLNVGLEILGEDKTEQ